MPLYRTLLCAIDFSEHSKYALRLAAQLAVRCGARLLAFHAIDPLLAEAAAERYDVRRLREDAQKELAAIAASELPADLRPEVIVEIGAPDRGILACAAAQSVDLVVMGSQGMGGVRKAFFGSVTQRVLRASTLPVLAVNGATSATPQYFPRGIVAAIEFDALGTRVLDHAAALASEFGVPLTVAHVVAPVQALPQYTDAIQAAQAARLSSATTRVQEHAAALLLAVPVSTEVRAGHVADELTSIIHARPDQLLVIGTGSGRLLHRPGSTAYRVLCMSLSPVLTIPPPADG